MNNPVNYINRESDGTTYWHVDLGRSGHPHFEEYASREDYAELAAWLRTKVCEGGDGCGAPPSVRPYSIKFKDDPYNIYFEWQEDKSRTVHYCDDCAHLLHRGWLPEVKIIEDIK